jgi:hypothetical protein
VKQSTLGLCVLASFLVVVGCSANRASKPPVPTTAPVTLKTIDLRIGTIQLPPEFSEKRTGTIDSRKGEISRSDPLFVITYDIGAMAGLHMHPMKKGSCLWFKEQMVAGQKCYMGMKKKGEDKIVAISILRSDGQIGNPWIYPANFWATVTTDEDIEHLKQIALSYVPKPKK